MSAFAPTLLPFPPCNPGNTGTCTARFAGCRVPVPGGSGEGAGDLICALHLTAPYICKLYNGWIRIRIHAASPSVSQAPKHSQVSRQQVPRLGFPSSNIEREKGRRYRMSAPIPAEGIMQCTMTRTNLGHVRVVHNSADRFK